MRGSDDSSLGSCLRDSVDGIFDEGGCGESGWVESFRKGKVLSAEIDGFDEGIGGVCFGCGGANAIVGVCVRDVSPSGGTGVAINDPSFDADIFDGVEEKKDVVSLLVVVCGEQVVASDGDMSGFVEDDPDVMFPRL